MIISNQKRMAAQILSKKEGREVGVHRVWINPDYLDEVSTAVQKDDIRQLIDEGLIKQGQSRELAVGVQEMPQAQAKVVEKDRVPEKELETLERSKENRWMRLIRAQRRVLKEMRGDETLTSSEYRYYRKARWFISFCCSHANQHGIRWY